MRRRAVALLFAGVLLFSLTSTEASLAQTAGVTLPGKIQTVFVIAMENRSWPSVKGSPLAPYINGTLLPIGAHAERYYKPHGASSSLPIYLWMEAGGSVGIWGDAPPTAKSASTTNRLVTRLKNLGITWKGYFGGIGSTTCPLDDAFPYTVRHNPFVYFNDVTDNLDPNSAYCIAHIRPLTELATDVAQGTVAQYNFIVPDLCHDMHSVCWGQNPILAGDTWLAANLPGILISEAYLTGGAVFITWDEPEEVSDRPVGMIVVSPYAKHGYSNWLQYDNSTLLRTVEEIVGIEPVLPDDIGHNADLSDLFAAFP